MTFRTPHDLLVYLVELSDDPVRVSALTSGQQVIRAAIDDGLMEFKTQDLDEFARLLFALREEGTVAFEDYAGHSRRGQFVGHHDADQAARITVLSAGRVAVAASRPSQPTLAINIANLDMTVLLSAVEEQVEEMDASEETKAEARGRLRAMREAAITAGSGAAGELIAAALRAALGFHA